MKPKFANSIIYSNRYYHLIKLIFWSPLVTGHHSAFMIEWWQRVYHGKCFAHSFCPHLLVICTRCAPLVEKEIGMVCSHGIIMNKSLPGEEGFQPLVGAETYLKMAWVISYN